jgi:hypothetical protein
MVALARLAPLPDPPPEDPEFQIRLDRLLRLTGALPDQPVGVAGPEALDLMCALARRGIERVEAALHCTCGAADEVCDLLIVSGRDADAIAHLVEAVGSMLKPGGRLAVMTHRLRGADERRRLGNLLAHRGFRYREGALDAPVLLAAKPDAEDLA